MTKFTENLKSFQTQQNLQYLINSNPSPSKEGVNLFASKVEDLIMHAAKKSMKIKKKKYRNKASNVCNKKWFDKECRLQRHSVRRLANQKHRDPLNYTEIRGKYHATLKIYKNTLKCKKEHFHEKKLEELERVSENDPNSFWKLLKNMSDDFGDLPSANQMSRLTAGSLISNPCMLNIR
jgi:hypothetical protein